MDHWAAILGGIFGLAGTAVLGIDALRGFRGRPDEIKDEEALGTLLGNLVDAVVAQSGRVTTTTNAIVRTFEAATEEERDREVRGLKDREAAYVASSAPAASTVPEGAAALKVLVQAEAGRKAGAARRSVYWTAIGGMLVGVGLVLQTIDVLLH